MPPKTKRSAKTKSNGKALSKAERKEVMKIVKGSPETKTAIYMEGTDGWTGANPGALSQAAWIVQNGQITTNNTDILRLIPRIANGTGEADRIGNKVYPVSLVVRGNIALSQSSVIAANGTQDLFAVIYVVQHTTLKSYSSLATPAGSTAGGGNDFTQFLSTGQGTTKAFLSTPWDAELPVARENYKLLAKKVVPLRWQGVTVVGTPGADARLGLANSHNYCARYTFNLSKHLPKIFHYPESGVTAVGEDDPTNSSIFMCMGYYRMDQLVAGDAAFLANQYVAELKYKDP